MLAPPCTTTWPVRSGRQGRFVVCGGPSLYGDLPRRSGRFGMCGCLSTSDLYVFCHLLLGEIAGVNGQNSEEMCHGGKPGTGKLYIYVAPPTPVGAWSMALGLRQRFEYYYYYYYSSI